MSIRRELGWWHRDRRKSRAGTKRAHRLGLRKGLFKSIQQLERRDLLAAYVVNSLFDTQDVNLLDDLAEDADGNTSLRAAIMQANATPGPDTITLPAGTYALTLAGRLEDNAATGDLDISSELTITGASASSTIIDAQGIDRVFDLRDGSNANLSGVTITGGVATDDGLLEGPGQGGGIRNFVGTLALANSVISGNEARGTNDSEGAGGGIYAFVGTTSMTNVTIRNNAAIGSPGSAGQPGSSARGGGIYSDVSDWPLVQDSTISENQALGGAGGEAVEAIRAGAGGSGFGGGIYSVGSSWDNSTAGNPLRPGLISSTISENRAVGGEGGAGLAPPVGAPPSPGGAGGSAEGGGVYAELDTWTILNTTISSNVAAGGAGGTSPVGNSGDGGDAAGGGFSIHLATTANISYVTVALNQAIGGLASTPPAEGAAVGGGVFHDDTGSVLPLSTIFATNTAATDPDFSGSVQSRGHNLVGIVGSSIGFDPAVMDQIGTATTPINPLLGPLQDNTGPTETHALLSGSPAIDAADPADFPPTDQRGVSRPLDGDGDGAAIPDIGAYEAPEVVAASIDIKKFVKKGSSSPSLGDDANAAPGPTIQVGETVVWTYVVTTPGPQRLSNVDVTDDNETPGNPFDDFRPAPITVGSGANRFNVGDVNKDNLLDPGESWLFSESEVVSVSGQHRNVGNVTASGPTGQVSASDPAHYLAPAVCVDMHLGGNTSTYGKAGNIRTFTAGGVSVKASAFSREKSANKWSTAYLGAYSGGLGVTDATEGKGGSNTHTIDNSGRNNYVLFEFSQPVLLDKLFIGYIVGDSDFTYWIGTLTDPYLNHTTLNDSVLTNLGFSMNVANSSTKPRWVDVNGGERIGNVLVIAASVSDSKADDRFKVDKLNLCSPAGLPKAAIDIEKATNGADADAAPGPLLTVGNTATFSYEVRNFGSIPLRGVSIHDDNGTPEISSDDFNPAPILNGAFNSGDSNQNNQLDVTEVWQYQATHIVKPGQYANTGKVSANTTDGRVLRDSDASHHFGMLNSPAIDIEKFVRGGTSQQHTGADLCKDHGRPSELTFVYTGGGPESTNTHQPQGKYSVIGDPKDAPVVYIRVSDRAVSNATAPAYFFGAVNLNEEFTFSAATGGRTKFASTTYFHIFADAAGTRLLQTVGYHTSCYAPIVLGDVTGGVTLTEFVGDDSILVSLPPPESAGALGIDADTPNGPSIPVGSQVTWTYRVTNTGNQPLTNVRVSDDHGTSSNSNDDFNPPALKANGFNVGDVNRNGSLDIGETWYYRAVDKVMTDDLYGNVGQATANIAGESQTVTDSDRAYYLGELPKTDVRRSNEYPQMLVMRYTADNVVSTAQGKGKVTVNGNLNGATDVLIKVTNKSHPLDKKALVYFDGRVTKGMTFAIDADQAKSNRLGSETYIHIFKPTGHHLRTIRFDTSTSQPLVLGDRFGGATLVGFLGEQGATIGIQPPTVNSSDVSAKVTFQGNLVHVDLKNSSKTAFATLRGLTLQWAYKNKELLAVQADGQVIFDTKTTPNWILIEDFKRALSLRRFGPGSSLRLTFEFKATASKVAGDFKSHLDLGGELFPVGS